MKRIFQFGAFIALLCLGTALPLIASSQAETLYEQAMVKETGERDPEAAIELYRQAIDQAGHDHRLVAKARLHIGNCLERMGKPKEAEEVYLEIVQDSAAALTEAAQAAQANLQKLEAQDKKALEEAERAKKAQGKPLVMVKEFHATRFSGLAGVGLIKSGSMTSGALDLGLRYRISADNRPLSLSAELGGFVPFGSPSETSGSTELKLHDQIHLAFVAELPHGTQRRFVPEMGAGAAITSNNSNQTTSPYFLGGVKLYPARRVSFLIEGSYTANPYAVSGFSSSLWNLTAGIQTKIGWTKTVLKAKE